MTTASFSEWGQEKVKPNQTGDINCKWHKCRCTLVKCQLEITSVFACSTVKKKEKEKKKEICFAFQHIHRWIQHQVTLQPEMQ